VSPTVNKSSKGRKSPAPAKFGTKQIKKGK
jgi:hypothetical protein